MDRARSHGAKTVNLAQKFCEGEHANGDGLANNIIIKRGKAAAHRGWGFVFLPFVVACINGK